MDKVSRFFVTKIFQNQFGHQNRLKIHISNIGPLVQKVMNNNNNNRAILKTALTTLLAVKNWFIEYIVTEVYSSAYGISLFLEHLRVARDKNKTIRYFLEKSSLFFHLFCIFQCSLTSWYQFSSIRAKHYLNIYSAFKRFQVLLNNQQLLYYLNMGTSVILAMQCRK